jgi:hypothetical protein
MPQAQAHEPPSETALAMAAAMMAQEGRFDLASMPDAYGRYGRPNIKGQTKDSLKSLEREIEDKQKNNNIDEGLGIARRTKETI